MSSSSWNPTHIALLLLKIPFQNPLLTLISLGQFFWWAKIQNLELFHFLKRRKAQK